MTTPVHPIEQWLNERGIDFVLADVNLNRIDVVASQSNQVRFQPVIREVVQNYTRAMKRGDVFPPLVGNMNGNPDRIVLIDGINRAEAARQVGRESFSMYLVDVDKPTLQILSYEANPRLNGRENTLEEREAHAVHLVGTGMTAARAAVVVGLPANAVANAMRLQAADERFSRLGLAKGLKLPPTLRRRLNGLNLDPTLVAVVRGVCDGKLGHGEVEKTIAAVNALGSEDEQLARVAEMATVNVTAKERGKRGMTARKVLFIHAAPLIQIDPAMLRMSAFDDADRDLMRGKISELADRLAELDDALQ